MCELKKYDITLSIIIITEAKNEKEALAKALVELEQTTILENYVTDTEIVEIDDDDKIYRNPRR